MSFHKRWITSEMILSSYQHAGISAVWDMYTRGADALILHGELAKECGILIQDGQRDELQKKLDSLR
jgi:hypothetical protein